MPLKKKAALIILALLFVQPAIGLPAEEINPCASCLFEGEIKGDDINIRSDSTVNAEPICRAGRGEAVEVISELYGWYKIRLPPGAPSFIRKDFVALSADGKTAKVLSDNVNIRLKPDTVSVILGKVSENDLVNVLGDTGQWYRIKPIKDSFGWVHKSFIRQFKGAKAKPQDTREGIVYQDIIAQGLVKPKTFTRIATHKLILEDNNKVYLLKADIEELNQFNNRKVKITGKLVDPSKQKYPVIKVEKIEALN